MTNRFLVACLCLFGSSLICAQTSQTPAPSEQYAKMQHDLTNGWNTWNTNTVASEVLLPQGLEVKLGLERPSTLGGNAFLPTALIGRHDKSEAKNPALPFALSDENIHPGAHAYDGSYSDLTLTWAGYELRLQTAHVGDDAVMLVTPVTQQPSRLPITAIFSVAFLWNQPGTVSNEASRIVASAPGRTIPVYVVGNKAVDLYAPVVGPYIAATLDGPAGVSTGQPRSLDDIQTIVDRQHQAYMQRFSAGGLKSGTLREAMETTIAWDTIYDPQRQRVISPVSRIWNVGWGGYVLFDWDTFFAADLASVDNRDLAYANVLEILNEVTPEGFVPNYARAGGWKSFDRSEPPVGAITVLRLYNKYHDRWLLEDTFNPLLRWNIWWSEHRDTSGYLTWGSDGENRPANLYDNSKGTAQGAKFESGLDNSPMYDTAVYDATTHQMEMADVGLMSMYIADSDALAAIADVLGKNEEAKELRKRAAKYRQSLSTLWDAESGIYLNKDLHTGKFSHRLSPTNLYPLLAKAASREQAEQMIRKHLLNPKEFWGDRVLPSISRDDPAFKDQDYWRGRIWGPMNYLVYLGLLNYDSPSAIDARRQLASKSESLFLHEWSEKGHVHENYSATDDDSDTVRNSDKFYHWGALLGLIGYEEDSNYPKEFRPNEGLTSFFATNSPMRTDHGPCTADATLRWSFRRIRSRRRCVCTGYGWRGRATSLSVPIHNPATRRFPSIAHSMYFSVFRDGS